MANNYKIHYLRLKVICYCDSIINDDEDGNIDTNVPVTKISVKNKDNVIVFILNRLFNIYI